MSKGKRDTNWRPKLKADQGAEAWCYYSPSGKTAEVYIATLERAGNPIKVVVPCYPPKRRVSR